MCVCVCVYVLCYCTPRQVLSSPEAREHHGYDATVVLTMLVNYRKYEAANPYVIKLSVLDDEIALNVSPSDVLHIW